MADRLLQQQNFFETTLSEDINSSTETDIYLDSVPTKSEGYLVISQDDLSKREIIYYTSVSADHVTCPATGGRGVGGTTAQVHDSGETVTMDDVASYHDPIIKCLASYRSAVAITFNVGGDDIYLGAGTVVVDSGVCINTGTDTLTDIGTAGTNKSGSVGAGGIRYIYAQDDGDGTFSAYVSNNATESGKRRLGYAKFNEGSTTVIRYVYNDDDYSQIPRGIIVEWVGPSTDIPSGFVICDGTAGTVDCRDKFVLTAGTTYVAGATGGASTVTLDVTQIPSHNHGGSTGSESGHYHGGTTGGASGYSHAHTWGAWTGGQNADHTHAPQGADAFWVYDAGGGETNANISAGSVTGKHNTAGTSNDHSHYVSGTTDPGGVDHTHGFTTGGGTSHAHSVSSQGGGLSHSNMPPYIVLVRIMKS